MRILFKLENGKTYKYQRIKDLRDELSEIYRVHSPSLVRAIEILYDSKVVYLKIDKARII